MSHGKRKHPGKQAAKAIAAVSVSGAKTAPGAQELLSAVADALNECEHAGISVKLAHGAVIADEGYVFQVGPDEAPWAVRTRTLTPFPVTGDADD